MINVILHFGIHKTGSSTIQHSVKIDNNVEMLRSQSLHIFSQLPANHSEMLITCFRDNPCEYHSHKRFGRSEKQVEEIKENYLKSLKLDIESSNCKNYLISGEDGCVMTVSELKKLRTFFESLGENVSFHLIFCTRNPLSYLKSAVQENVKGNNLTIDRAFEIHSKSSIDRYQKLAEKLREVFPFSKLSVFPFEGLISNNQSLLRSFFSAALQIDCNLVEEKRNEAISDVEVLFQSYCRNSGMTLSTPESLLKDFSGQKVNFLVAAKNIDSHFFEKFQQSIITDLNFLKSNFNIEYTVDRKILGVDLADFLQSIRLKNYKEPWVEDFIEYYTK
jgi:hypothetical protein